MTRSRIGHPCQGQTLTVALCLGEVVESNPAIFRLAQKSNGNTRVGRSNASRPSRTPASALRRRLVVGQVLSERLQDGSTASSTTITGSSSRPRSGASSPRREIPPPGWPAGSTCCDSTTPCLCLFHTLRRSQRELRRSRKLGFTRRERAIGHPNRSAPRPCTTARPPQRRHCRHRGP
jgi:hypothetical protein